MITRHDRRKALFPMFPILSWKQEAASTSYCLERRCLMSGNADIKREVSRSASNVREARMRFLVSIPVVIRAAIVLFITGFLLGISLGCQLGGLANNATSVSTSLDTSSLSLLPSTPERRNSHAHPHRDRCDRGLPAHPDELMS